MSVTNEVPDGDSVPVGKLASLRVKIELWVAVALMALGFFGGVLIGGAGKSAPRVDQTPSTSEAPQGNFVAPPLDENQLTGPLPSGHPTVGSGTSSSTTP